MALSGLDWKTPFGVVAADRPVVRALREQLILAPEDPELFFGEHSIGVLVPFVRRYFPGARIVPIIVNNRLSPGRQRRLVAALRKLSGPDVHVLLSMDFCHDKPPLQAASLDAIAADAIRRKAFKEIKDLDIDCRVGLSLLLRLFPTARVQEIAHSDTAMVVRQQLKTVTSYFTFCFLPTDKNRYKDD
jgi:AmmeMemoRadiSam system protein B